MAKYNFDENLIKASYNKDLYSAKREWFEIGNEIKEEQDGLCICQRKVKHIIYMYNPKTKLTIIVGSKCAKKFKLNNKLLSNNILRELFKSNLLKGNYEIINNIIRYSNNIEEELIKYFINKIDKCNNNKNKLFEIKDEIKELIEIYSLKYLNNIYKIINNKIIDIEINNEQQKYNKIKIYFNNEYYINLYNNINKIIKEQLIFYDKNKKINNNNNSYYLEYEAKFNNILSSINNDLKEITNFYENNNYINVEQLKYLNELKYRLIDTVNKINIHNELLVLYYIKNESDNIIFYKNTQILSIMKNILDKNKKNKWLQNIYNLIINKLNKILLNIQYHEYIKLDRFKIKLHKLLTILNKNKLII